MGMLVHRHNNKPVTKPVKAEGKPVEQPKTEKKATKKK